MKLVDNWKRAWRWWSVRLSAAGAVVMGVAEVAGHSWASLPPELRDTLPHAQTIGLGLFIASALARLIQQETNDGG